MIFLESGGSPYGEARRLRYFVVICRELLKSPVVNIDFFADRLLMVTKKINPMLLKYVRTTGILNSKAVARNYLRFADWLNFIRLDNRLVVPNSYTVFFANLSEQEDFFLTKEEKVGFFLNFRNFQELSSLLASLKIENAIKDFIRVDLSEHFVESFFEWFLDLGIVKPTSPKFGRFILTNLGYQVRESSKNQLPQDIYRTYISNLLGFDVQPDLNLSNDAFWSCFDKSLQKHSHYIRSEINHNLYSALSSILDMQIRLVFEHHKLVHIDKIIEKLKDISSNHDAIFSWDSLAKAGYVKINK